MRPFEAEVKIINQQLVDEYGKDVSTNQPKFRVVFSDDQFEMRHGTYDDFAGQIYLRTVTEVRRVPRYSQWIPHCWVLERLCAVPLINEKELPDVKLSYEPIYPFMDSNDDPLPPLYKVAKIFIDSMQELMVKKGIVKYEDEEAKADIKGEATEKRIKELEYQLYGDHSGLRGTTLNSGQSIIVPNKEFKE